MANFTISECGCVKFSHPSMCAMTQIRWHLNRPMRSFLFQELKELKFAVQQSFCVVLRLKTMSFDQECLISVSVCLIVPQCHSMPSHPKPIMILSAFIRNYACHRHSAWKSTSQTLIKSQ